MACPYYKICEISVYFIETVKTELQKVERSQETAALTF